MGKQGDVVYTIFQIQAIEHTTFAGTRVGLGLEFNGKAYGHPTNFLLPLFLPPPSKQTAGP